MVHKVIATISVAMLLLSCSDRDRTFFDQPIQYQSIGAERLITFQEVLQPRRMRMIDERLYVSDFSNQPSFHVLKPKKNGDLSYIRGVGTEGRGPGEFVLIEDFADADSLIYIFDGQQLKFNIFDPESPAATPAEVPVRTKGRPLAVYGLPDGRFVTVGLFPNERFQVYGSNGERIAGYGELFPFNESFSGRQLAISWYSFSAVPPSGDYLYLFSSNSDHIEKYSLQNGDLLKTLKGDENPYPRMKLETVQGQNWPVDDGSIYGYLWADADEQYIYALYSGELQSDLDRFKADKIHVLDYDLNLVTAYQLDHYPFTMAADGHGGLYTVTNTADGALFRYLDLGAAAGSGVPEP